MEYETCACSKLHSLVQTGHWNLILASHRTIVKRWCGVVSKLVVGWLCGHDEAGNIGVCLLWDRRCTGDGGNR